MIEPNPKLLRQYLDTDARLMPLRNWQAQTKDGLKAGKLPVDFKWQHREYDNNAMVGHMVEGQNVGFKVGQGWGVLDYDPRNDLDNGGEPKEPKAWTIWRVLSDFGIRPGEYAFVETGGGGLHIYLRIPDGYTGREKIVDKYGKGVEFKTSPRRYVVTAGSVHPGQNGEAFDPNFYQWGENSLPLADTCEAPEALLEAFKHQQPPNHMQGSGDETFGRFTPKQLEDVLSKLDIENYGANGKFDWFEFMCACHWFTGGEGREEFVDWSTGDGAYSNHDEIIRTRWDSLDYQKGAIKSGIIFKHLKQAGVSAEDMPRERASQMFDEIDPEELEQDLEPSSKEAKVMKTMNKDHAFIMVGGVGFVSRQTSSSARPEPWTEFSKVQDIRNKYANNRFLTMKTDPSGNSKLTEMTHFDYWFRHPERREYEGVEFLPDENPEFMTPSGLFMNLWKGWPFDLEAGRGTGDWSKLRMVIRDALCAGNERSFEYFMRWMAYSLQHVRGPQRVALVMRGPKGVGKGIVANAWCRLFGNHHLITDDDEDVFGRFNARIGTTCALFLDEALWAGDRKKLGAVKARITEPTFRVEQKFQPSETAANHMKIMMATNEQWAVPATDGERRFVVLDCISKWPSGSSFYGEVLDELYGETRSGSAGLRAMYFDLMNMDLGGWQPEKDRIMTKGLGDQVRQGFGDAGEWWYEILSRGHAPFMFDLDPKFRETGPVADWEKRPVAVPMTTLRDSLDAYFGSRPRGELNYNFRQRYATYIMKMMPDIVQKNKRVHVPKGDDFTGLDVNGRGAADCFIFPPLPELREHLETLFGLDDGEFDEYEPEMGDERVDDLIDDIVTVDERFAALPFEESEGGDEPEVDFDIDDLI